MRTIEVIGIGAGNPQHLTLEAIEAMNRVDTFFFLDKGDAASSLVALRKSLCDKHIDGDYSIVTVTDPPRDRTPAPDDSAHYARAVDQWHDARAQLLSQAITEHTPETGHAGLLVWGDPALYDSTLRIVDRLRDQGMQLALNVIPGISAVAALTAAFGIPLNRVNEPVLITTGRQLHALADSVTAAVVMLDAHCSFREVCQADDEVFWGAYLGTEDELLISGMVGQVGAQIAAARARARAEHGWIMDTYLIRRRL